MPPLSPPTQAVEVLRFLRGEFGERLLACYLHGSATGEGLQPSSDLDLLAVVSHSPTLDARARLAKGLLELSVLPGCKSGKRPVELTIFHQENLLLPVYPIPCEWVYGEWLRDGLEAGAHLGITVEPEYTLLLAQARQHAVSIFGPPLETLMPPLAMVDLKRANRDQLPLLLAGLEGDARNTLLTLSRLWFTHHQGAFAGKIEAAQWALGQLPEMASLALHTALEAYRNDEPFHASRADIEHTFEAIRQRIGS